MAKSVQSEKVFSGIRWGVLGQVASQVLRFGSSIILARLLAPEDFGLLGMALVITGFAGIFYSLGTSGAIVQKETLSPELLSSLCIINIAMGCIIAAILAVSAPLMAVLYDTPGVAPIIQVLGVTYVILALGLVHAALLRRDMRFDRLVQIEFVRSVVQGSVAICLAYLDWKVWALVVASITSSMVSTCLLWWVSPWHFQWTFRWSEVKAVMGFSLNLTGAQISEYLLRNTDKFVIGRFLGATSLGYYSMTYSLYVVPQEAIRGILSRVLFPAFSRMQNDDAQLRKVLLRAISGVALLMFPLMLGLGTVASPFVIGLFGEKWRPIIPLVMIFSPIAILLPIGTVTGQLFLAKGRSDWLLKWNLAAGTVIILSFICGLPWGIVGVSVAYATVMLPLTYLSCAIPFRLINLPMADLLTTLRPYASASAIMVIFVLCCRLILEYIALSPIVVLAVSVLWGAMIYMAIIFLWRPPVLCDVARLLPMRWARFL